MSQSYSERVAAAYNANRANQRAAQVSAAYIVQRYLDRAEQRGELLPGAVAIVFDKILGRNHAVIKMPLPRAGRTAADCLANCVAYLESEGKFYANPAYKPDPDERPLTAMVRRLGATKEVAEKFYADHAALFAGRSAPDLMSGVFPAMVALDDGKHLVLAPPVEYTPPNNRPGGLPASATVAELAAAWREEREAAKQAQAGPQDGPPPDGPLERHLATARGAI
jgi:hypothetical protein